MNRFGPETTCLKGRHDVFLVNLGASDEVIGRLDLLLFQQATVGRVTMNDRHLGKTLRKFPAEPLLLLNNPNPEPGIV